MAGDYKMNFINSFFFNIFFSKIFLRSKCLIINSFSVFFSCNQEKSDRSKRNRKENQAIIATTGSIPMAKRRKELV